MDYSPPYNIDVEKQLIASLFYSPKLINGCLEKLKHGAFYSSDHKKIYREIELKANGKKGVDIVNIGLGLKNVEGIEHILAEITDSPTTTNVDALILTIEELYIRRKVGESAIKILEMTQDNGVDLEKVAQASDSLDSGLREYCNSPGKNSSKKGAIVRVKRYEKEITKLYDDGIDFFGIKIKEWPIFSEHFRCIKGTINGVGGIPSHGKSTLVDDMMIHTIKDEGWKWAVFSPENRPKELHIHSLVKKILNQPFFGKDRLDKHVLKHVMNKLDKHIFFINPDRKNSGLKELQRLSKIAVDQHGVDGIIYDPWNKIETELRPGEKEKDYIRRAIREMLYFSEDNNVCKIVTVHPTKMEKIPGRNYYGVPTLYNMSGSSDWYNGLDNGLTGYKTKEFFQVHVQKIKQEMFGKTGLCYFKYQPDTGKLKETTAKKKIETKNTNDNVTQEELHF